MHILKPVLTRRFTESGVAATRVSPLTLSLGTPTVIPIDIDVSFPFDYTHYSVCTEHRFPIVFDVGIST